MAEPTIRPSATGEEHADMLGAADAETDADGQRSLRAEPGDVVENRPRQGGSLAGDAGYRNVIDEAGGPLGDFQCPIAGRDGRDELDQGKILAAADVGKRSGFLDGQVGHYCAGYARRFRIAHVFFQPVAVNDGVTDHGHNGDRQAGREFFQGFRGCRPA